MPIKLPYANAPLEAVLLALPASRPRTSSR